MSIHVRFGTGDEEGSGQVQHMEPGEIDIAPIHDVDRARLREQQSLPSRKRGSSA
jgi:hypothetical protein